MASNISYAMKRTYALYSASFLRLEYIFKSILSNAISGHCIMYSIFLWEIGFKEKADAVNISFDLLLEDYFL